MSVKRVTILFAAFIAFLSTNCMCKWLERFKPVVPDNLIWEFDAESWVSSQSSLAIGADGTIYFGNHDGSFFALDPDGNLKWRRQTGQGIYYAPAIGVDGTVYFGSADGSLYALMPTGDERWVFQTRGRPESSPAIDENQRIWFVETEPADTVYESYDADSIGRGEYFVDYYYSLCVLNPDGTLYSRYQSDKNKISSPSIGKNGTVYITRSVYLYAIDPQGGVLWKFQTKGFAHSSSPAIANDGTIFFGSQDHYFYAVNPDGSLKWRFQTQGCVESSPAVCPNGDVYFGSYDGYLYALNENGELKWEYETGGYESGCPAIGVDGTVYFFSYGGTFYAFNPDGSVKWSTATGWLRSTSPTISADGTIYFGVSFPRDREGNIYYGRQDEGAVYALKDHSGGLLEGCWSKFRGDCRNTGRLN